MKNLVPYEDNCLSVYESIARAKSNPRKELLTSPSTMEFVTSQYDKLSRNLHNLSQMNMFRTDFSQKAEIRKALLHCYEVPTTPLNSLKIAIENLQSSEYGAKCQYCGVNIPNTFDHYLPKSVFPEFSTHPHNLLPCCAQCNQEKGDSWIDDEGIRFYINLYFDHVPEVQYLQALLKYNIQSEDKVPKVEFQLINRGGIDGELFSTISHHFERLDLLNKYENLSNGVISTVRRQLVKKHPRIGESGLKRDLAEEAESLRDIFGKNNWQACLIDALAKSERFIDSCM
uniref:HNH endonuclease n=1 Tax=Paenibacillus terrae TaxID=159743 RepID=UPI0011A7357F|nr:HNH endonuclease [Paenibacillus terrae]